MPLGQAKELVEGMLCAISINEGMQISRSGVFKGRFLLLERTSGILLSRGLHLPTASSLKDAFKIAGITVDLPRTLIQMQNVNLWPYFCCLSTKYEGGIVMVTLIEAKFGVAAALP